MVAFSFKTKKGSNTVYLVPNHDEKRIGWKKATAPIYAFIIAETGGDPLGVNEQSDVLQQ